VFAQTTRAIAVPHGFACVVIQHSYIFLVSSKSIQVFGGRNLPFTITLAIGFYNSLYSVT